MYYIGKKPSSIKARKTPNLPFPHVATAPTTARSYILTSVRYYISLVTTTSFGLLIRARLELGFTTSQLGLAIACYILVVVSISYILAVPYILSLIDYYYIRPTPLEPQRRKGDLFITNTIILKGERDIYILGILYT